LFEGTKNAYEFWRNREDTMRAARVQDVLSGLLHEIQDLRANQKVLTAALVKAERRLFLLDAADLKKQYLEEADEKTAYLTLAIRSLDRD
jgi:hypothetical protein